MTDQRTPPPKQGVFYWLKANINQGDNMKNTAVEAAVELVGRFEQVPVTPADLQSFRDRYGVAGVEAFKKVVERAPVDRVRVRSALAVFEGQR
jgi:hypothetical protein